MIVVFRRVSDGCRQALGSACTSRAMFDELSGWCFVMTFDFGHIVSEWQRMEETGLPSNIPVLLQCG